MQCANYDISVDIVSLIKIITCILSSKKVLYDVLRGLLKSPFIDAQ
jgi:hypothetical protein